MQRGSGILMHISSLPSPYGIGTLGEAAYKFVDFLEKAGQKYWQVLPVSPTGFGDSPYQSYSAFAGNPYFIDFDRLADDGGLCRNEYTEINWGENKNKVDYEKIAKNRIKVLKEAYLADKEELRDELLFFKDEQSYWVEDYAMFMALKEENDGLPYWEWDDEIKLRTEDALFKARIRLAEEIDFWIYVQYRFYEQWFSLKEYANSKGIKIIGDVPIYVAEDSADAWSHKEVLMLDEKSRPIKVAGCPPDYFSPKGQLWGNPLYNWDYLKSTGYEWWILRIKAMLEKCDIVRIDHFRAFSAYYSIPFGNQDAVDGKWVDGPSKAFFDALSRAIGDNPDLIAEDLGFLDDGVKELLAYTGFPGMKVLQFAFSPEGESDYLPHKYQKNCVAYIGTHDNNTLLGWYESERDEVRDFASEYLNIGSDITLGFIKGLLASVADVAIITMQDILGLGSEARMNTPGASGDNWMWRLFDESDISDELAERIRKITRLYGR